MEYDLRQDSMCVLLSASRHLVFVLLLLLLLPTSVHQHPLIMRSSCSQDMEVWIMTLTICGWCRSLLSLC